MKRKTFVEGWRGEGGRAGGVSLLSQRVSCRRVIEPKFDGKDVKEASIRQLSN